MYPLIFINDALLLVMLLTSISMTDLFFSPLMDFPFSAGIKHSDGYYTCANDAMAEYTGKCSVKDLIGIKDAQLSWKENWETFRENDRKVEKQGKALIFIEPARKANNQLTHLISIKTPLNRFIEKAGGIVGGTIPLGFSCHETTTFTMKLFELLKLNIDYKTLMKIIGHAMKFENLQKQWKHARELLHYETISFTLREAQCLHYFFHNYSAEKTAEKLFISKKTVEFHLAKIKGKLQCSSAEIVNNAIDQGFIDIMFMNF